MSHSTESLRRGTLMCLRKSLVSKNVLPSRVISRYYLEEMLSRSSEKFRSGTLLCCVSESFRQQKSFWIRKGEEGIKIFRRKFLSHSVQKIRRGTLSCFTKILVYKTFRDKRGGEGGSVTIFCQIVLVPQCQKIHKVTFFVIKLGYRKTLCLRVLCHVLLLKNFLSGATEKLRRGTLLCCVSENFH